jgi:hypothetical protein
LKKRSEIEIHEERDALMRSEYYDPIERFPEKMDKLLDALNRVCFTFIISPMFTIYILFSFTCHKEMEVQVYNSIKTFLLAFSSIKSLLICIWLEYILPLGFHKVPHTHKNKIISAYHLRAECAGKKERENFEKHEKRDETTHS